MNCCEGIAVKVFIKRRRVGMADEADSKSVVGSNVWVQVPSPALIEIAENQ